MRLTVKGESESISTHFSERFFILIMWNDADTPLAYLISFRCYGTWLHGDERGSIDRSHNIYGEPYLDPSKTWQGKNRKQLKTYPFILRTRERGAVEHAIRETCSLRKWRLQAINVRTNHVHTVVTANCKPELVLNAFKANATRKLKARRLWLHPFSPWARRGSQVRLWTESSVANAINYVLHGQGNDLPHFDD